MSKKTEAAKAKAAATAANQNPPADPGASDPSDPAFETPEPDEATRAAADMELPDAPPVDAAGDELAEVGKDFKAPMCGHCGTQPMKFAHCVYKVNGVIEGSKEHWRLMYCANCDVLAFGTIIHIERPAGMPKVEDSRVDNGPRIVHPSAGVPSIGRRPIPKNYPKA